MKTLMTAAAALALIAAAPQAAMATGGTAADKGLRGAAAAAAASEDAKTIGKIEIPDVTVSEPVEDASQAKPGLQPAGAPEKIGEIKTPDIEVKPPLKDRADAKQCAQRLADRTGILPGKPPADRQKRRQNQTAHDQRSEHQNGIA